MQTLGLQSVDAWTGFQRPSPLHLPPRRRAADDLRLFEVTPHRSWHCEEGDGQTHCEALHQACA